MQVREVTVATSRKLGLPGYSSLDVNAAVTVSLAEGDDVQEAFKRAWDTVEEQVVNKIKSKGLDSPVASEAQDKTNPQDWLDHDTPEVQVGKIAGEKRLQEHKNSVKVDSNAVKVIPSVKPSVGRGGGD